MKKKTNRKGILILKVQLLELKVFFFQFDNDIGMFNHRISLHSSDLIWMINIKWASDEEKHSLHQHNLLSFKLLTEKRLQIFVDFLYFIHYQ